MTTQRDEAAVDEELDWEVEPPTVPSGVIPRSTLRPDFDMSAYARESEERLAVADFASASPAPDGAPATPSVVRTKGPSAGLHALASRSRPR